MDDFANQFKSMIENLIKSGVSDFSFDIKSFDANNAPPFMQMFFGGNNADKKEKVVVRKLSDEEIGQYTDLNARKEQIQNKIKRLLTEQKKLELDFELFWHDIKDASNLKTDAKKLTVDTETGFLFQEVNVCNKEEKDV